MYKILNTTEDEVKDILKDVSRYYISYPIRKKNRKKKRFIDAPQGRLKEIQKSLLRNFLYKYKPHPIACGFVKNKSAVDGAKAHVGQKILVCMDIYNFFGSITTRQVENLFKFLMQKSKKFQSHAADDIMVENLAQLVTYKGRVPQGAPTSPVLSNLICLGIDKKLKSLETKHKCKITRYADDISCSSSENKDLVKIIPEIKSIFRQRGFKMNKDKTRVSRANKRMKVTGIVVNDKTNVPSKVSRNLRAKLHNMVQKGERVNEDVLSKVRGKIEWITALNPHKGNQLLNQYDLVRKQSISQQVEEVV
tara:strand:- start:734 stop:1654 length:921 start_codon:yes stop_codon:yes gene_type:complete